MADVNWGTSSSGSWTTTGPATQRSGSDSWGSTYIIGNTGISTGDTEAKFFTTMTPGPNNYGFIGYDPTGTQSEPDDMAYCLSYQATNVRYYNNGTWVVVPDSTGYDSTTIFALEITPSAINVYINDVLKYTDSDTVSGTFNISANMYTADVDITGTFSATPPPTETLLLPPPVAYI